MLMSSTAETPLLRLATAGSVDDGKSTLIGRLLYDSKSVLQDQLDHVEEVTRRRGAEGLDLSLLTDGLRAEREQGITIDVAYRYFATPNRSFILADTPGHEQYTRNMVTGASTADVAILLVDARHGIVEQTRRHASIAALLGIRHLLVAVNKMDLVDWSEERFDAISREFCEISDRIGVTDVAFVPISALLGDNVVEPSSEMPWYGGRPLLEQLEAVELSGDRFEPARFPVQYVIRDAATGERRYAGQVAGGEWRAGDEVVVLPGGERTTVVAVETFDGPLEVAGAGRSVTLRLADERDVSRGTMLAHPGSEPTVTREFAADVCWMATGALRPGARVLVKHTTATVRARVEQIDDRLDVVALDRGPADALELNDIGRVRLRTAAPLCADPYAENRATGAFVLIDEDTNDTVGAGMIRR